MDFIDLFAGLGGFHKALKALGHRCVFASELDPMLRVLYEKNWGKLPYGDIRKVIEEDISIIPPHDVLCAGFPCQPFSKAGKQKGLQDIDRGTLFDEIIKILDFRKPKYFILENVPFIAKHNNEETWKEMEKKLRAINYDVDHENYSPHEFGIPQHRMRIFIVGQRKKLEDFNFEEINKHKIEKLNLQKFILKEPKITKILPKVNQNCLNLWQEFIDAIPKNVLIPGFPIWGMEFGATYPYEKKIPYRMTQKELEKYKGNFGISLKGLKKKEQFALLPSYARTEKKFPDWKISYIKQSRKFYEDNKKHIEEIVKKISKLPSQSWQKLEWNVGTNKRIINKYIIQFRASGIRIKNKDFFPSLVCTNTQIPIIGWKNRYITKEEGAKLQSMEGIQLPETDNSAFKALGNAVNVKIIKLIAKELLKSKQIQKKAEIEYSYKIKSKKVA